MIGFVFFLIALTVAIGYGAYFILPKNNVITTSGKISGVGKAVVDAYNALPAENRPFPNIVEIVKVLDEKTGFDPVDRRKHFDKHWLDYTGVQLGGYKFDWKRNYCSHRSCEYAEYYNLYKTIQEVQDTIKNKQKAILESKLSGNLDIIKELQSELRNEAGLNREFVRKFKELE